MPETYVALDLETTGLDPRRDEIIEVGAVKFRGPDVLEQLSTFVRPRQMPPAEVQGITGIRPEDLLHAPPFAAIAGDLLKFVGDWPLVIQNASFDLPFLAEHGLPLPNRVLDTLEIARVLLGQLPERNLPALASHFGIDHEKAHRALADALAAKDVFLALRAQALALDPKVLMALAGVGGGEWGLHEFFQELMAERITLSLEESLELPRGQSLPAPRHGAQALPPVQGPARGKEGPLDVDLLASLLEPNGIFAKQIPAFEHRTEQITMMRAVAEALNDKEHLIVEAGTGTGKSMAYLLPALVHAVQNGTTVVVATNTIALQDQIVAKDLPALLNVLGGDFELDLSHAKYAVLKGRGNYICPRRFNAAMNGAATGLDTSLIARIAVWLAGTSSGDRAELNLNGGETSAWRRLSAESDNCPPGQCAQVRPADCFLQRARQRAGEAHLVIVNHALLIADLVAGGSVLPDYDYLIVDEAHHLEDVATDQLGFRIGQSDILDLLDQIEHETAGRAGGLLAVIEATLRGNLTLFAGNGPLLQHCSSLRSRSPGVRAKTTLLFGHLADFLKEASDPSDYGRRLRLTSGTRHHHLWERVEQTWDEVRMMLQDLREGLERLATGLKPIVDAAPDTWESTMNEVEALHMGLGSLVAHGNVAMSRPDPEWVCWVGTAGKEEAATVYAAPIEVGPMLAKGLFQKKATVVLTSATLKAGDGFGYIESRVGLEKPREVALESSFPYSETALLLLPKDIPPPQQPGHYRIMEQALADLCLASDGRALLLFTSYSALQSANRALRAALEPAGLKVLAQGGGLSVQRMLHELRTHPRTVLLGTSSFWEGVDVVGEALSLLVITRLPFTVPTEPVFQARSERFEDPFSEYAVPQAVLRFRQGFGRLIRSRTDRGVCVVLDPRIAGMRYGKAFLEALPPATVQRCTLREAPKLVESWLETRSVVAGEPA